MKEKLRGWARRNLLTLNTIRYRCEFARIHDAFKIIGKQETLFDGGAGGGQMIRQVYEAGYCCHGTALEYDSDLYKILSSNLSSIDQIITEQGSLLDIPHPDDSFDCAMTTQVLEHIEDHEQATSELARIVKPNGYIIVSVPHPPEPFPNDGHVREGYEEIDLDRLFPAPFFKRLSTGYSLIRATINRAMFAQKLPFKGKFMPVAWADCETKLSNEERKDKIPFAITCLYKKLSVPKM